MIPNMLWIFNFYRNTMFVHCKLEDDATGWISVLSIFRTYLSPNKYSNFWWKIKFFLAKWMLRNLKKNRHYTKQKNRLKMMLSPPPPSVPIMCTPIILSFCRKFAYISFGKLNIIKLIGKHSSNFLRSQKKKIFIL